MNGAIGLFWRRWPLAVKITSTMTLSIVIAVASVTLLSLRREEQTFRTELKVQARLMLDILGIASQDALYYQDVDLLSDLIERVGRDRNVISGRIYDSSGRIVGDTDDRSRRFDLHPDLFGAQLAASDTVIFQWQSTQLLAGQAVKVGDRALGAVSIGLSTAPLQQKMALVRDRGIIVALTAALGGMLVALLLSRSITHPLRYLVEATHNLAEGNLDQKLLLKSEDELATLTEAFNSMAARLRDTIVTLQQTRDKAEVANTAKSEFLANMSHELRTPLNAILGFTQILQRSDTSPSQQREYIDIIHRSGEHLLALINDILEMSKIEAGRISLNPNNFDLYRLLDTLEEMFDLRAQSKGLQLLFERNEEVPQYLCTDENKLRQVLINLLGNAIKFTPEGGVVLRVGVFQSSVGTFHETSVQSSGGEMGRWGDGETLSETRGRGDAGMGEGGDIVGTSLADNLTTLNENSSTKPALTDPGPITLHFEVEDSGVGIAPEEIDSIFKAFSQTESGLQSQEGTGLGLPISRKFVELLGGELRASSTLNRGSIFHFNLPVTVASADEVEEVISPPRVIGLAPDQVVPRILIVEDNPTNRYLLMQLLMAVGLAVREASNGQEALEIWQDWQPDLIWMDMQMPVMNGYQATQAIKASSQGKPTVIVALTASALEEDRTSILAAGCDDFVRKPFREAEIFTTMEKFLGLRYVYEQDAESSTSRTDNDTRSLAEHLRQIPPEWVAQLKEAAVTGFDDKILQLIEELPAERTPLAQALRNWTHDFNFDAILALVQED